MAAPAQRQCAEYLLKLRNELLRNPMERVPVEQLKVSGSPRDAVEDPEHSRTLAENQEALPPVVVHRASMTVIDGIHRLRAAHIRGRSTISVRFFDGSAADSRLLAVALNVTHGLPLTMAERTAAAEHILTVHPEWSDRAVASVAGLSSGKTADIRRRLLGDSRPGAKRVGRDGRVRPLDPAQGRERAAALLRENPAASLRQVAREAGVSPGTVADVRTRAARSESTTLCRGRPRDAAAPAGEQTGDVGDLYSMLRRDPALRLNEAGRSFLRLLDAGAALDRHREGIAASLPPHCKAAVARLAQVYAQSWQLFAKELQ